MASGPSPFLFPCFSEAHILLGRTPPQSRGQSQRRRSNSSRVSSLSPFTPAFLLSAYQKEETRNCRHMLMPICCIFNIYASPRKLCSQSPDAGRCARSRVSRFAFLLVPTAWPRPLIAIRLTRKPLHRPVRASSSFRGDYCIEQLVTNA